MHNVPTDEVFVIGHKNPDTDSICSAIEAAAIAAQADVGEMWLTHYSPSMTKPAVFMDEVRSIFPRAIAAKDRMTTTLKFNDEE